MDSSYNPWKWRDTVFLCLGGGKFFWSLLFLKCCFQKLGEAPAQLPFPVKQHSPSPLLPTGARWMTMKENEGECRLVRGIEGEWRRALNDNVGQRNPVEDQRKSPILSSDRCDPPAFSNSTAEKFLRQIISVCLTCFLLWLTLENTFSYIWPASHLLMRTRFWWTAHGNSNNVASFKNIHIVLAVWDCLRKRHNWLCLLGLNLLFI